MIKTDNKNVIGNIITTIMIQTSMPVGSKQTSNYRIAFTATEFNGIQMDDCEAMVSMH